MNLPRFSRRSEETPEMVKAQVEACLAEARYSIWDIEIDPGRPGSERSPAYYEQLVTRDLGKAEGLLDCVPAGERARLEQEIATLQERFEAARAASRPENAQTQATPAPKPTLSNDLPAPRQASEIAAAELGRTL